MNSILVVDDVVENLDILVELLSPLYSIKAATSGAAALKIADKTKPDLILLDVVMPGMDGYEACRLLRQNPNTRDIPVVFVTANESPDEIAKGISLGAVDYLSKPIDPEALYSVCDRNLKDSG